MNYYVGNQERANSICHKHRKLNFQNDELNKIKNNYLKCPQWIILNRNHAKLFVTTKSYTNYFEKTSCPDEHYFSTILKFKIGKNNMSKEIIKEKTTFDDWINNDEPYHPRTFLK